MATLIVLSTSFAWASSPKLSSLIGQVAQQEGLDPNLLKAVVAIESKFDTVSVSNRGAVGLMQLMPDTARLLGVSNRFNPEQNLRGGARYLRQMIERYPDSLPMALAAYNAGPSAVNRFGGVPPFPATKRYIDNVLSYFAKAVPGSNHSPRKIYHYHKRQNTDMAVLANTHQRIVRLLGDTDDDEEVPSVRSPRPTPAPKAVHTSRNGSAHPSAKASSEPARSLRLIPYASARPLTRYQVKNAQSDSEEIPVVILRR
ncbi:MAG: lytic transglycosylase domain-containing protein [Magnetococcales bacterium]|nr:lytic transglycosylase domain-containing protein [Magnetococcales bacterium]